MLRFRERSAENANDNFFVVSVFCRSFNIHPATEIILSVLAVPGGEQKGFGISSAKYG